MKKSYRFAGLPSVSSQHSSPARPVAKLRIRAAVEQLEGRMLMAAGPRIWSVSPQPGSSNEGDGFSMTVWFDQPIADVTTADFALTNATTGTAIQGEVIGSDRYINQQAISLRYFCDPGAYAFR